MASSEDAMSAVDAITTTIFGIGLPSFDVYSDIFFAYTLVKPECRYKTEDEVQLQTLILDGAIYQNMSNPDKIFNEIECKEHKRYPDSLDYYGHPKFGILVLSPLILSFLFTLSHWWKLEGNWKNRLMSLPFLLLQCWPQYRMARILYLGLWKKDKKWRSEKETMDRNVGSVGRYLITYTISIHVYNSTYLYYMMLVVILPEATDLGTSCLPNI